MKDEIKEIKIIKSNHSIVIIKNGITVKEQFAIDDEILDYITNLQEENSEQLDENLKLSKWLVKKQKRIEKAREHIKKEIADIEWMKEEYSDYDKIGEIEVELKSIEELNDILNGDDNN